MTTQAHPRQSRSLSRFLLAAICLLASVWISRALWMAAQPLPLIATDVEAAIDPSFLAGADLDRLIATYAERITQTSTPSDHLNLGFLYLERARLTSDPSAYAAAASSFETAAELSPQDPTAVLGQARAALAIHDFARAEDLSSSILRQIPTRLDALAVQADARMAVGDVAGASRSISLLSAGVGDVAPVLVRRAELAWLEGRLDEALELAERSVPDSEANSRRLAWYEGYAGTVAWRAGALPAAKAWAELALEHDPEAIVALTLGARLAQGEGDLQGAADLYERATSGVPDPELVGELGDVYDRLGQSAKAELQWDLVDVMGTLAEGEGLYDRSVARFYADHDVETDRALALAQAEIEIRQDPLGYDTLAWALYRADRFEEARSAMDAGVAGGFISAEVQYHQGLILLALGDIEAGKRHLEKALNLNPSFDLRGAEHAREILSS
ncbi:MAG TPA: tetratricopeptide repeat protein [Acidimicrobiia bacterium]